MKPSKKPKHKFDVRKFEVSKAKKEKDLDSGDLFKEILRSKSRNIKR